MTPEQRLVIRITELEAELRGMENVFLALQTARERIAELEAELARSDITEAQLHAALVREERWQEWMREARFELRVTADLVTIALVATAMRRIADACPLAYEATDER
jgi:hypothetical protein